MLLEDDGLDSSWEHGTQGDWETDWGLHDRGDAERFGVPRDYDSSRNGIAPEPSDSEAQHEDPEAVVVKNMSLFKFRDRLIRHFSSKWRKQQVQWPTRNGQAVWVPSEQMRIQAAAMGFEI